MSIVNCGCREGTAYGDGRDASIEHCALHDAAPDLLAALKAMVASYEGLRDSLTCPTVKAKLAAADAAIANAEGR